MVNLTVRSLKNNLLVPPTRAMNVIDTETRERTFMSSFRIDAQNNITAFGSEQIEGSGGETFSNRQELAAIAEKWPAARLVDIWNSLPGVEPVQRFTSRQVALTRIWNSIQGLDSRAEAPKRRASAKKRSAGTKTPRAVRKRVGGPS